MKKKQLSPEVIGKIISDYRNEKGITQEVLSGLADIGRSHLSAIERGERKPTLETLFKISIGLEVPMYKLVKSIEDEL